MGVPMSASSKKLFGTDGVRGIVNEWLTPEQVTRLALAIGSFFKEGSKLLVGRDARAGNSFIVNSVISALLSTGVKVYYAGLAPTPALQYYVKHHDFDGGVIVTASHNPPEYSGIKVIMDDGIEAPRDAEKEIEAIYWELKFRRPPWNSLSEDVRRVDDVNEYYIKGILELLDIEKIRKQRMKVVVDPGNNVGSLTTPKLLRTLNIKVTVINGDLSHIPDRPPEPLPENLQETVSIVKALKADLGIAHDGDADRAIFIDDRGRVIPGDRSALLLCKHIVKNRGEKEPSRVVTAVSSSTLVEDLLREYGIEVVWTRVGSIDISRTMTSIGALAGFEENGGFMYPRHQYVRDGAMALGLMLEFLSTERRRLSELYDEIPKRHIIKTKIPIKNREEALKAIEALKVQYRSKRVIDVDGIKVIDKNYWFLVRPSGTEPILRIFVESDTEELAKSIYNEIVSTIKDLLG